MVLERKPATGPAESGHDLVQDQHDPVAVREPPHTREVAVRRHQHTGGTGYRFEQDRGDAVGTLSSDHALEVLECPSSLLRGVDCPELAAVGEGPEEVHMTASELVRHSAPVAGGCDRGSGIAVVRP